jgi:hypothetical protein
MHQSAVALGHAVRFMHMTTDEAFTAFFPDLGLCGPLGNRQALNSFGGARQC